MIKRIWYIICIILICAGCSEDLAKDISKQSIIETKYKSIREQREVKNREENVSSIQTKDEKNKETLIKVGFCQVGAESGWRIAHTNSMKDIFTKENGYELYFTDANGDPKKQIDAIRTFIKNKVNVIVLAPVIENGWDEVLIEAKNAKIPVIIVDRMINTSDDSLYTCWVGSNFKAEGLNALEWLIEYMKTTGKENEHHKVVVLRGTIGASAESGRTAGIREGLSKYGNYELIAEISGNFTTAEGKQAMSEYLKINKDFDVLFSQNDDMTFGAIEALKEAGIKPGSDVTIISFDGVKDAFQLMINGEINADIECNPLQGPFVSELIQKILANENLEKIQYMYESVYDSDIAEQEIKNRVY